MISLSHLSLCLICLTLKAITWVNPCTMKRIYSNNYQTSNRSLRKKRNSILRKVNLSFTLRNLLMEFQNNLQEHYQIHQRIWACSTKQIKCMHSMRNRILHILTDLSGNLMLYLRIVEPPTNRFSNSSKCTIKHHYWMLRLRVSWMFLASYHLVTVFQMQEHLE